MPPRPRSAPLAEAKARVTEPREQIASHKRGCVRCTQRARKVSRADCEDRAALERELRNARTVVREWFAPGEDDVPLFDISEVKPKG